MAEPRHESVASNRGGQAGAGWALALMLALFALTLALSLARHGPPPPRPAAAPPAEFSAARAREVQRQLVGDGRPHPVGSAADDRVRQTIVATLSGLGLSPRVEEGFACHWRGSCARVRNVVARLDGREPGAAVAIAAHYDSVGAGPGACDDLAGVAAAIEIARAMKSGPPPRHTVLLLLDEGEESGLLGATAFEDAGPEAAEVRAVVNLEARGSSGPSLMFETSGDNGWMIDAWAPRARRPVTTSLSAFIYTLLPNDTDLTVFRHHRVPGLNFAFIESPTHYHTPADNFANASAASLQHQGELGLAAVTGLANSAVLQNPPPGRVVYFDVLSLGIVRWPAGWTLPLAALALLLVLAVTVAALAGRTIGGGDLVLGLLALPAMLLATALLAYGATLLLQAAGALAAQWIAHPLPALAAFWLLPLTLVAAVAPLLAMGRRSAPLGLWLGIWLVWAALGVALAALAPATSFIFVVPALAAGICGLLGRIWRGSWPGGALATATIVPALAAAVLWWGVLPSFYVGLGSPALPIIASLLAILYATAAPLIAAGGGFGRRLWALALALTLLALIVALPQPRYSRQSPQSLTYTFHQDGDTGTARWVLRALPPLPAPVRRAVELGPPERPFPWAPPGVRFRGAAAPPLPAAIAPPPEVQVLESAASGGKRHLRLRLVSRRGASAITLWVPAGAHPEAVSIEGHRVPDTGWRVTRPAMRPGDWLAFSDLTLPATGCEIRLTVGDSGPLELYAVDETPGLPPTGAALLAARPPEAVPIQQGDTTVVSHKLTL
jgi:Peptidase family M28